MVVIPTYSKMIDKNLLLPREKYDEASKAYGKSPFTFEIENNKQTLFYFGANHSPDPNNNQYPKLKEYWNKFLNKTNGQNCVVLVESWKRPIIENEEEAIQKGNEGTFMTLLAYRAGIPTECPEPEDVVLYKKLSEQFPRDHIVYYKFAQQLVGWQKFPEPRPDFDEFVSMIFRKVKRVTGWDDYDFSIEHMLKIHKDIFNEKLAIEELKTAHPDIDVTNPNKTGPINKVARFTSDMRDLHIALEIERYWKDGKNIFVVFGSGHLIIQEPALKILAINNKL